jgi:hypothetical protein
MGGGPPICVHDERVGETIETSDVEKKQEMCFESGIFG